MNDSSARPQRPPCRVRVSGRDRSSTPAEKQLGQQRSEEVRIDQQRGQWVGGLMFDNGTAAAVQACVSIRTAEDVRGVE